MKTILVPFQIDTSVQLHDIEKQIENAVLNAPNEEIQLVFPELTMSGADAAEGYFRISNKEIDIELIKLKKI